MMSDLVTPDGRAEAVISDDGCCSEPSCTRLDPLHLYRSASSGRVFVVTRYRRETLLGGSQVRYKPVHRHEVTRQMVSFLRRNEAWVRSVLDGNDD